MKTVSPAMARALISISEAKRPWDMRLVERFEADMRENRWVEGASVYDPIRVVDGRLVNGKLRLAALSRAGVTLKLAFVYEGEEPQEPGWVKTYREQDGDLIMTVLGPDRKTAHDIRVTRPELSSMLAYLTGGDTGDPIYIGRHRREATQLSGGCPECGMLIQCKLSCSRRDGGVIRFTL